MCPIRAGLSSSSDSCKELLHTTACEEHSVLGLPVEQPQASWLPGQPGTGSHTGLVAGGVQSVLGVTWGCLLNAGACTGLAGEYGGSLEARLTELGYTNTNSNSQCLLTQFNL